MKKPLVIHPFLLALFPIVFLYAHNIEMVLVYEILLPAVATLGFTLLSILLLRMVLGEVRKAGMIVSVFWVLFFSYSRAFVIVEIFLESRLGGNSGDALLLLGWAILFGLYVYLTIKTADPGNWTKILNVVAVSVIAIPLVGVGAYEFRAKRISHSLSGRAAEHSKVNPMGEAREVHPDIYYIVLDRYASSSTLQELFHFDNRGFTEYLASKGFYIALEARANYARTFQSLAAALNMEHLTYLTDELGRDYSDQTIVYAMLRDYEVWRFLKSRGYTFLHFGSRWEPTRRNKYADVNFTLQSAEFPMMLYRTTLLYPIGVKLGLPDHRQMQQQAVLRKLDKLAEVPNIAEPTFVFAHILLPHPPYMFGAKGEMLTQEDVQARTEKENYLNQLAFTNEKIKELVDRILSESDRPPIIVLQADEGPLDFLEGFDGKQTNWRKLSDETLRAHMRVFSAYYLPNTDYEDILYPSVTPVNSFRIIFDHYFSTNYGLLEDTSYIFEDLRHPYAFIDVTSRVAYHE
jgi:hypothetical protein